MGVYLQISQVVASKLKCPLRLVSRCQGQVCGSCSIVRRKDVRSFLDHHLAATPALNAEGLVNRQIATTFKALPMPKRRT